jgi:putative ABC transport system permease protein
MPANGLSASRLRPQDVLAVGSIGLRTRKLRGALSALGIAIGIASMVAVLGISGSSQANLLAQLDRLGTNLLTVAPGSSFFGNSVSLPSYSAVKARSLANVDQASAVYEVSNASALRSKYVDSATVNGVTVEAADLDLVKTLGGSLKSGHYLTKATERFPTVVLGAVSAQRLGIDGESGSAQININGQQFTVVGILKTLSLAADVDRAALIGLPEATKLAGSAPHPSTIYVRANVDHVDQVHSLLPATAFPQHPEEVEVSRPSDTLAARAATKNAFTGLLLGLGAVALLVGGVGIANVMVISVLERRSEVGLRRALGAAKRHITVQFLTEAILLGAGGGLAGVVLGSGVTVVYAISSNLPAVVPLFGILGGLAVAVAVAAVAGLYPAVRAARLAPTEALRTV